VLVAFAARCAEVVEGQGIGCCRSAGAEGDAFVIDIEQIRGGHLYQHCDAAYPKLYYISGPAGLTHRGDYFH